MQHNAFLMIVLLLTGIFAVVGTWRTLMNFFICRDVLRRWGGTERLSAPEVRSYFGWFAVFVMSVVALWGLGGEALFELRQQSALSKDSEIIRAVLLIVVLNVHWFVGRKMSPERFFRDLY